MCIRDRVKPPEALRIGLVNEVVADAQLMEKGLEMARMIAAKAPVAVRVAKQAVQRGLDLDLANGCVLETTLFAFAFGTADRKEGMTCLLYTSPSPETPEHLVCRLLL